MKLAPLTARTFESFKKLGFLGPAPRRCILIEHEGAIVAGAVLLETEDRSVTILGSAHIAQWIAPELRQRALKAIVKATSSYCTIVATQCLALMRDLVFLEEGWADVGTGMFFDPLQRAPERPAQEPELPQETPEPTKAKAQPEPPQELPEDDPITALREQVAQVERAPKVRRKAKASPPSES